MHRYGILLIVLNFYSLLGISQSPDLDAGISSLSQHPIAKAKVNDLEYYYIEKGEGETIFFLHGFPDMANSWDPTIAELSKDYHCVAPFLRGYYPTSIAPDGDYGSKTIARDIDALARHMGVEKYYVVGQDWGASVTYSMINLYPHKIKKAVTVAIPHPSFIKASPVLLYKARHFLKFANEKKSVPFTRKKNFRYIDVLYKRWSPTWENFQESSDQIKETFKKEGRLEAALGYYWTFNRQRKIKDDSDTGEQFPQMPLLTVVGKKDGALIMKQFYRMEKKMPNEFKLVVHDRAGHFLHREEPEFFISHLQEFLKD